jgi:hypothetical protein
MTLEVTYQVLYVCVCVCVFCICQGDKENRKNARPNIILIIISEVIEPY